MELSLTVLIQVFIMFLLMSAGVICYKTRLIDEKGTDQLVRLLLYVVNVGLIINAYNTKYEEKLAFGLLTAMGLAIISHIVGIVLSFLFYRKKDRYETSVTRFGIIYSNCGFMAIPLISAVFPENGVFYSSAYIIIFNLFSWTQGILMMSPAATHKESLKRLINPVIISVIIGLPIFFFKIPIPFPVGKALRYIADLNTPMAMIIAGIYIIRSDILSAFKNIRVYAVSFFRLILIPFIMIFIIRALRVEETVAVTVLIATAAPSAITNMLFAAKFKADAPLAVRIFVVTTLLSILTIPFIVWLYRVIPI